MPAKAGIYPDSAYLAYGWILAFASMTKHKISVFLCVSAVKVFLTLALSCKSATNRSQALNQKCS